MKNDMLMKNLYKIYDKYNVIITLVKQHNHKEPNHSL